MYYVIHPDTWYISIVKSFFKLYIGGNAQILNSFSKAFSQKSGGATTLYFSLFIVY